MISADAIRGYVDIMILSILERQASYPYELVKTIARVSRGEYVIKQMESQGLVDSRPGVSESGKPRTYYRITAAGNEYLRAKCEEWQATKAVVDRFVKGQK